MHVFALGFECSDRLHLVQPRLSYLPAILHVSITPITAIGVRARGWGIIDKAHLLQFLLLAYVEAVYS